MSRRSVNVDLAPICKAVSRPLLSISFNSCMLKNCVPAGALTDIFGQRQVSSFNMGKWFGRTVFDLQGRSCCLGRCRGLSGHLRMC